MARMRERAEAIATLLTLEQGKPLAESRFEVMAACELIKWYAEEAKRVYGRLVPSRLPGGKLEVLKQPVGPVLALSPWNYPVILSARKIGGALAAGCSVVLKAAEETPAAVAAMVDCFQAELPPGALQLVYGDPAQIAQTLIASPVIRKVSFTGSVAVGRQLARLGADGFKRHDAGTWRPCARHPVGRCRPGPRGAHARGAQVPERGPGLPGADPVPGAQGDLPGVRRSLRGHGRRAEGR